MSEQSARWAAWVERRCGLPADPHRRDDLTSRAWELMVTYREKIIAADNPWGYLTRAVLHAAQNAALADALLTSPGAVQGGCISGAFPAARLGQGAELPSPLERPQEGTEESSSGPGSWGAGLHRVHAELVAAGTPPSVSAAAIDRVVHLAAWARRGWREATVKDDPVLRALGLTAEQSRLLLALVAGPRRAGVTTPWKQNKRRY